MIYNINIGLCSLWNINGIRLKRLKIPSPSTSKEYEYKIGYPITFCYYVINLSIVYERRTLRKVIITLLSMVFLIYLFLQYLEDICTRSHALISCHKRWQICIFYCTIYIGAGGVGVWWLYFMNLPNLFLNWELQMHLYVYLWTNLTTKILAVA